MYIYINGFVERERDWLLQKLREAKVVFTDLETGM